MAVCSLGDGAITEGEVSAAIHMAVLKQYPILYFVQDNGWDISASSSEIRNSDIGSYFKGFGEIDVVRISGNDFIESYLAIQKVINIIRKERRPFMIHADVPLLNHHRPRSNYNDKYSHIKPRVRLDPFNRDIPKVSSPPWARHYL